MERRRRQGLLKSLELNSCGPRFHVDGHLCHHGLPGLLLQNKGFPLQTTGWIVAVYVAVAIVFQLIGGFIGDRIPKQVALFIFTSIQAGAVVALTMAGSLGSSYLFAILFGIGFGGRNPLTIAVRGECFGRASFGKILGLSTVPMNILLLVASLLPVICAMSKAPIPTLS